MRAFKAFTDIIQAANVGLLTPTSPIDSRLLRCPCCYQWHKKWKEIDTGLAVVSCATKGCDNHYSTTEEFIEAAIQWELSQQPSIMLWLYQNLILSDNEVLTAPEQQAIIQSFSEMSIWDELDFEQRERLYSTAIKVIWVNPYKESEDGEFVPDVTIELNLPGMST